MALVLAKKEKIGVFVLAKDNDGDEATLSYRGISAAKKSNILKKHSKAYYAADFNKLKKGDRPEQSKIYLDNDNVDATMEILAYCVTDIAGVSDEDGNFYKKEDLSGTMLYNLLDMVDKLDDFMDVVSGRRDDKTKN